VATPFASTLSTAVFELVHATTGVLTRWPARSYTATGNVALPPTVSAPVAARSTRDAVAPGVGVPGTVTTAVSAKAPLVTMTAVRPALRPRTTPPSSTVATVGSRIVHRMRYE
jgi:hypothetical protein